MEASTGSLLAWVILAAVSCVGLVLWVRYWRVPLWRRAEYFVNRSAQVRWGFLDVLIVLFVWLSSQVAVVFVLDRVAGIRLGDPMSDLAHSVLIGVTAVSQLLVVIGLFALLVIRYRHRLHEFGLTIGQLHEGVRWGLIGFAMWMPIVWLVQMILVMFIEYEHPTLQKLQESPSPLVLGMVWISAVVVAPIVEEVLFRGVLQGWLQRIRPGALDDPNSLIVGAAQHEIAESTSQKKAQSLQIWPIVITSVLFGLAHYSQGPAPISLFVLSLGLGYLYQRTGSLLACIFVHALLNGITMLIQTVDVYL
ncbi:MAG: CPBP family intramembrane glutamic endopeptidase [Pirellulaceae bacterium]